MIANRHRVSQRSGTAAVECGVVLSVLLVPLMIGIWEVGRLVYVQQVLVTGCREGARYAAQGVLINSSGTPTNIYFNSGSPSVQQVVFFAINTGGLPQLTSSYMIPNHITCTLLTPYVMANSTDPTPTDPYNSQKGQPFRIAVSIDWSQVRWISLGIINPTTVYYQVDWTILRDSPFSVNTTLPIW